MYHYVQDKDFLKRMRGECSGIVNQLVQRINRDSVMKVTACLVGSGARNLVTQNANEPVDLDYNLIIDRDTLGTMSEREIKEYVRKQFNAVLAGNGWGDCKDSTSVLTTARRKIQTGNPTPFSIDLGMISCFNGRWHRLIHAKTGIVQTDRWYWNEVAHSDGLEKKVAAIKAKHQWLQLRTVYLDKKNTYLRRNDTDHPSFIVYIEAVNQIYNTLIR
ncbi:hypothetical protein D1646_19090 [Pseudoflavonifractor sp. 60]|uniref:hypothetical protein n=1 Tax=Pseudoflavonifractor sp. 60 TaxID=2304576 RepID=UPI00136C2147|nr:hypothetical protein [Pseudoflavonifractor sp. 60]NBI68851.1 hypothetical protein [Pseudoflavonifractor sp. 60]